MTLPVKYLSLSGVYVNQGGAFSDFSLAKIGSPVVRHRIKAKSIVVLPYTFPYLYMKISHDSLLYGAVFLFKPIHDSCQKRKGFLCASLPGIASCLIEGHLCLLGSKLGRID